MPKARALAGAANQAGNVGDHEMARLVEAHHAAAEFYAEQLHTGAEAAPAVVDLLETLGVLAR